MIVVPTTSRRRDLPSHVEIDSAARLDAPSYAKCEDVNTISTERLTHVIGAVSDIELGQITTILARLLAM